MKGLLTFLIVFSVVVIFHEFGHFFFARRGGILVREFSIGMGPKIFGHQGKDGTAYTLRLLPIGGYVRMAGVGEDETEITRGMPVTLVLNEEGKVVKINTSSKVQLTNGIPVVTESFDLENELYYAGYVNNDETQLIRYEVLHDATIIEQDGTEVRIAPTDVQFQSAKLSRRMMTNFAGPMNNFILAILLFIVIAFMQGGVAVTDTNAIGAIQADSPAATAGLKEGDQIQTIDGEKISSWQELTTAILASPDQPLTLSVKRGTETFETTVTPETTTVEGQKTVRIGIQVPMATGFMAKIIGGFKQAIANSLNIFQALGDLIVRPDLDKLGGPVAIFQMSSQAAQQGFATVLAFIAILSMNLGIINLFPFPALDGGKLVLNVIEGVRGKPMSVEKEGLLNLIGFGALMLLMILVTWNDIQRFFFH